MASFTLHPLPRTNESPVADNSPVARLSRTPLYGVTVTGDVDSVVLFDLLTAFFDSQLTETVRAEWVRLRVPATSSLPSRLLSIGAAIPTSAIGGKTSPCSAVGKCTEVVLLRDAYWQLGPEVAPWLRVSQTSSLPFVSLNHFVGTAIVRAPLRPAKPAGGTIIYQRWIVALRQMFTLRVLDVNNEREVVQFSNWQNNPRVAAGWMQTAELEEHRQYLHQIDQSLHVIAVIGDFDGEDVLYSELYWIKEDPLAPLLPHVDPFDRGFHSLVGSEKHRGLRYIKAWSISLAHLLFLWDTRTQTLMVEPRQTNTQVIWLLQNVPGFILEQYVDLPHKRAARLSLSRERFFMNAPFVFELDSKPKL